VEFDGEVVMDGLGNPPSDRPVIGAQAGSQASPGPGDAVADHPE
jgi:hypothetical protein